MIFAYGIQTYKRSDLPQVRLVNQFAEKTPTSRVQLALLPRPGLAPYLSIGAGPIRGVFNQPGALDGSLFAVSGEQLYKAGALLGALPGLERVNMAATINRLLIANDESLYSSDGATVSEVAFPELPVDRPVGASSVGFINGYAFATHSDTRRLYYTLDPDVWDDLDYISAETSTGKIIAAVVVSDQIWIFCEKVTEVWVTTGVSETPFQRVAGRLYDKGCLSRDTIVKMDNSVIWVGHDGIVYRGDNAPTRISDHGIEERIAESEPGELRAWSFPWIGHLFYVLTTSSGTVVFDAATGQWWEASSYGRTNWRAHLGLLYGQDVIAGDDEAGKLWKLDGAALFDDGVPIERLHTGFVAEPTFVDNVVLNASSGSIPDYETAGIVELAVSRDQGMTFGPWRQASLGTLGQYRRRIAWRRLGMADGDGMVINFRMTDPTPWRLSDMDMNQPMGGRGRT